MEPFKIKVVEPITRNTRQERLKILQECDFNVNMIQAKDVIIDLHTDSGCSAMSHHQWGALVQGDESYLHASSFTRLCNVVKDITGFPYVIPTHQGRGAEIMLANVLIDGETHLFSNAFFATTRKSFTSEQSTLVDLSVYSPGKGNDLFGGNIDEKQLETQLSKSAGSQIIIILTVTNQCLGGQPVSMDNIKRTSALCKKFGALLLLDACRYAENAWLIKVRENSYSDKSPSEIAREMFDCCDGCFVSGKKDGLSNCGGFVALSDKKLFTKLQEECMRTEGFVTYGGLSGRDMDAMAVGLKEGLENDYLKYRIESVRELGEILKRNGAKIIEPVGGNSVIVDAETCLDHIDSVYYPAWALTCALYVEGGVRALEYGNFYHGTNNFLKRDCIRLSLPRRVYTLSHMLHVGEVFAKVLSRKKLIGGMTITDRSFIPHFAKALPIGGYLKPGHSNGD